MGIFKLILQGVIICIYCLLSAYVLLFGKKKTGIISDYLITSLIIIIILFRMS